MVGDKLQFSHSARIFFQPILVIDVVMAKLNGYSDDFS